MATITNTYLEVYRGFTSAGTQVGSQIVESGSPASVNLNNTTLGAALQPGRQYCVRAKVLNSDSVESEWTDDFPFRTLIWTGFNDTDPALYTEYDAGCGGITCSLVFDYDSNDATPRQFGVYLNKTATDSNAIKIVTSDMRAVERDWFIDRDARGNMLEEGATYYGIPFVIDDLGREYRWDWRDALSANIGYRSPVVTISNVATTSRSISGNISVSTRDTITGVEIRIWQSSGGQSYYFRKTAIASQAFTISDGDVDKNGNTISINPSTEYTFYVTASIQSGCQDGKSDNYAATTAQASSSTIIITSVTGIKPTEATANLAYGDGRIEQQPAQ